MNNIGLLNFKENDSEKNNLAKVSDTTPTCKTNVETEDNAGMGLSNFLISATFNMKLK